MCSFPISAAQMLALGAWNHLAVSLLWFYIPYVLYSYISQDLKGIHISLVTMEKLTEYLEVSPWRNMQSDLFQLLKHT